MSSTASPQAPGMLQATLATGETSLPIIMPSLSLPTRLNLAVRLWTFKIFVTTGLAIFRYLVPPPPAHLPTLIKTYPCRPGLRNRIFIPSTRRPDEELPLYLDIHGGGFAVCDPQTDDEFCATFAATHHILVVSIDYRKAPCAPFPVPVEDAAAIAEAVIDDYHLPIDRSRIALGGFSAGANLALAIAQRPPLRQVVRAVVAFYPALDFTVPVAEKLARRTGTASTKRDMLESSAAYFNWGYVSPGQDRRDPRLSPVFARKEDLPPHVYLVGAEFDMLCSEARDMAERLARRKPGALEDQWEDHGIRWELAKGLQHGFTHVKASGKVEMRRKEFVTGLWDRVGKWLLLDCFVKA
ncbi:MAG: hypothetical protein M1817_000407 [Caeruleum heppii]|nr:MAG: hypothetical protein M1817_000407 [Caeruleum heppii]